MFHIIFNKVGLVFGNQTKDADQSSVKQYAINQVCSALARSRIETRQDLIDNMEELLGQIHENPQVFKGKYTESRCFTIFTTSIHHYQRTIGVKISINEEDFVHFERSLKSIRQSSVPSTPSVEDKHDLLRLTKSYDQLEKSHQKKRSMSEKFDGIISNQEYSVCPHVILGAGDAGTTVWLEKYKEHHGKSSEKLDQGELPEVLMIAETLGNWKHDYTLAQPHSLLERGDTPSNPSAFTSRESYDKNPYTNARHLYQSNVINLAKTDAPVLSGAKILRIEKREAHFADWKRQDCSYRLVIRTPSQKEKTIYTEEINICAGLGVARNIFPGNYLSKQDFDALAKFDQKKQFTPIVDGNQFMLSDKEEQSQQRRTILIYGGGGNATACYRKAFHGNDNSPLHNQFAIQDNKHDILWFSRDGFESAGYGTLAKKAVSYAEANKNLFCAELREIIQDKITGKLKIRFNLTSGKYQNQAVQNDLTQMKKIAGPHKWKVGNQENWESDWYEIECDQFVYSTGQDASGLDLLSQEFKADLSLDIDKKRDMPTSIKTSDEKIYFFGAAAQAIKGNEYFQTTRNWIVKENINKDSEWPGVMPPSRAQIKKHAVKKGASLDAANVNIDDRGLIKKFLKMAAVDPAIVNLFINDLIARRQETESGMTRQTLQKLLDQYHLNDKVQISGHCHLILKSTYTQTT